MPKKQKKLPDTVAKNANAAPAAPVLILKTVTSFVTMASAEPQRMLVNRLIGTAAQSALNGDTAEQLIGALSASVAQLAEWKSGKALAKKVEVVQNYDDRIDVQMDGKHKKTLLLRIEFVSPEMGAIASKRCAAAYASLIERLNNVPDVTPFGPTLVLAMEGLEWLRNRAHESDGLSNKRFGNKMADRMVRHFNELIELVGLMRDMTPANRKAEQKALSILREKLVLVCCAYDEVMEAEKDKDKVPCAKTKATKQNF